MTDPTLLSHWEKQIEAYRESGLTLQVWCDREGVSKDRMKYWMYKRKVDRQPHRPSATFVPVHVESTAPSADLSPIWVQVGEVRVGVAAGFDPRLLRDVVEALRSHV